MVGVVDGLRWCLFGTEVSFLALAVSGAMGLLGLLLGATYFRRVERTLADVL
jgi:ABC-type polysaccharide/polyol phosphate export permease